MRSLNNCTLGALVSVLLTWLSMGARGALIADFRDEYQAVTFPSGWSYQTNSGGDIGSAGNYANLIWSGTLGYYNLNGGSPMPRSGSYVYVSGTTVHPGQGTSNGSSTDRYVIVAYTLAQNGPVYIADSLLRTNNTLSGGVDLQVYVNNSLIRNMQDVPPSASLNSRFDGYLGNLAAGDKIYVAVGPNGSHDYDSTYLDFSLRDAPITGPAAVRGTVIAGYRDDFLAGGPATGWHYLWNNDGAITNRRNFAPLQWSGSLYSRDVVLNSPESAPAGYVRLNATGGIPGRGTSQGAGVDRYVIAAYVVPNDGEYELVDGWFRIDTAGSAGANLRVFVDDGSPVLNTSLPGTAGVVHDFSASLGLLTAGQTLYVAVGPNGADDFDGFSWDFSIYLVPEPASLALLLCGGSVLMRRRSLR